METHVVVRNAWKSFDHGRIDALKGMDLEVGTGEIVSLHGTSGCGKSTLLNVISGLEKVTGGEVTVSGRDVRDGAVRLDLLRHHIGRVFPLHHLMPDLTLAENCMMPVIAAGGCREAAAVRLIDLTEATGMRYLMNRPVGNLNGGERQRGALVRALMNAPKLLLCDEPTGELHGKHGGLVADLIFDLVRTRGLTLILATQDPGLAKRCDRIVRMRDGRLADKHHR